MSDSSAAYNLSKLNSKFNEINKILINEYSLEQLEDLLVDISFAEDLFSESTKNKARNYNVGSEISTISLSISEDLHFIADISGADDYVTQMNVHQDEFEEDDEVSFDCSCPVGEDCKHAAALCRSVKENIEQLIISIIPEKAKNAIEHTALEKDSRQSFSELQQEIQALSHTQAHVQALSLPRSSEEWLKSLNVKNKDSKHSKVKEIVFLIFIAKSGEYGVLPYLIDESPKKSFTNKQLGSFDEISSFLKNSSSRESINISQEESTVFYMLQKNTSSVAYGRCWHRFTNGLEAEQLLALLATKKVYIYHDKQYSVVSLGDSIQAEPSWKIEAYQTHPTFHYKNKELIFLSLGQVLYYDHEEKTIGALSSNKPHIVAINWMRAPSIQNEYIEIFSEKLHSMGLPVVPYADLEYEIKYSVKPIPKISWFNTKIVAKDYHDQSNTFSLMAANFSFSYDGISVGPSDKGEYIVLAKNEERNKTVKIKRNKSLEATRTNALEKYNILSLYKCPNTGSLDTRDRVGFLSYSINHAIELWSRFYTVGVQELQKEGWEIVYSDDFINPLIEADEFYFDFSETQNAWFEGELGITINGKKVSLLPILPKLVELSLRVLPEAPITVSLDGKIISLDPLIVKKLLHFISELTETDPNKPLKISKLQASILSDALNNLPIKWAMPSAISELKRKLKEFKGVIAKKEPETLQTKLRDYQQMGLAWLGGLHELGFGGILADDMGLGKTVQIIAFILDKIHNQKNAKPVLLIAPTSVVPNWLNELSKFAPSLNVTCLHGAKREEARTKLKESNIIISSYAIVLRDYEYLKDISFSLVAADEAQYVKNCKTKNYINICSLKADMKMSITGTPLENNLSELWSHMNMTVPGLLPDIKTFKKYIATPIEKDNDTAAKKMLAERIKPFILRRTKELVARELPAITQVEQFVEFENEQKQLYETIRSLVSKKMKEVLAKKGASRSHIEFLDALLKLRQVCCDPRLVKMKTKRVEIPSAKLLTLMEIVAPLLAEKRKILIFSQFTSMLKLIENEFQAIEVPYCLLTGETVDRKKQIDLFQNTDIQIFLISLKAGGTGLNLTAADTVILYDPWWNPAVEDQAIARAHRIGQAKPVFVYKLLVKGTIEEKILSLQAKKRGLVDGLLSESGAEHVNLTAELIEDLFN